MLFVYKLIFFLSGLCSAMSLPTNLKEIQIFGFWRPFCLFFENAVSNNFQSYQPILLILNSEQGTDFY